MPDHTNTSEIKVLTERLIHFSDKLSDIQKSIEKMDSNIEKLREKVDQINIVRIPSITEELSSLRSKAAIAGGLFGILGSAALSLVLWMMESWHR